MDQRPCEWEVVTLYISAPGAGPPQRDAMLQRALEGVRGMCLGRAVEFQWVDLEEAREHGVRLKGDACGVEWLLIVQPGGKVGAAEWEGGVLTVWAGEGRAGEVGRAVAAGLWSAVSARFPRPQSVARWSRRGGKRRWPI